MQDNKLYKKKAALGILAILSMCLAVNLSAETYTLSIVPQFSASKIEKKWQPVMKAVHEKTGIKLELIHHKTIPEFEQSLADGKPDIAYMNPFHAYRAKELQGYDPVVRDRTKLLYGQLWVHKDSGITDISQLDGQQIVFPAPNAFGASLYMRALLTNKFGVDYEAKYVKTHSNVYRHVAMKKASAGGGVFRTYNAESQKLKDTLVMLYETPGVRPHPICVHERVPQEVKDAFAQALVELDKDPENQPLFDAISMPDPEFADYEKDYAPLGELKLKEFVAGVMK